MSDSDDDMEMPGLGDDTAVAEEKTEIQKNKKDIVIAKDTTDTKEVKLVSAMKKPKKGALRKVTMVIGGKDGNKENKEDGSLSVIKKLQNAMRVQTDRARQEAGHMECHQPTGTQPREEKPQREQREPSNILRVHQDQALFVNGWHTVCYILIPF